MHIKRIVGYEVPFCHTIIFIVILKNLLLYYQVISAMFQHVALILHKI